MPSRELCVIHPGQALYLYFRLHGTGVYDPGSKGQQGNWYMMRLLSILRRFTFRNPRIFLLLAIPVLSVNLTGCGLGDKEGGSCKFHVISYGAGFSGWYIVDNDDPVVFSVDTATDGAYIFSKQIETPSSSIYIFAQALNDNTSSISIMVYNDNDLLASNSTYKVEDESLINEVTYSEFGNDDAGE